MKNSSDLIKEIDKNFVKKSMLFKNRKMKENITKENEK